jgi:hypothetical protein
MSKCLERLQIVLENGAKSYLRCGRQAGHPGAHTGKVLWWTGRGADCLPGEAPFLVVDESEKRA